MRFCGCERDVECERGFSSDCVELDSAQECTQRRREHGLNLLHSFMETN